MLEAMFELFLLLMLGIACCVAALGLAIIGFIIWSVIELIRGK